MSTGRESMASPSPSAMEPESQFQSTLRDSCDAEPWRAALRYKPLKKVMPKPVTIAVGPSMCQPAPRVDTPPSWVSVLGNPQGPPGDLAAPASSSPERSAISVRQVFQSVAYRNP